MSACSDREASRAGAAAPLQSTTYSTALKHANTPCIGWPSSHFHPTLIQHMTAVPTPSSYCNLQAATLVS